MSKYLQFGIVLAIGLMLGSWYGNARKATPGTSRTLMAPPAAIPSNGHPAAASGTGPKLLSGKAWQGFQGNARDLLARALEIPGRRDTTYFLYRALEEIPANQLPAFAAELSEIPTSTPHQYVAFQEVLRRWLEQDASAALAWAQTLPVERRKSAMRYLIGEMAESNADEALRLASGLGTASERAQAVESIVRAMAERDPAAAFALMKQQPNRDDSGASYTIFRAWAKRDPMSALAALSQLPSNSRSSATYELFRTWAEADPQTALSAASTLKSGDARQSATSQALTTWATNDLAAATAWYQSLSPAVMAKTDPSGIFRKLTAQDPASALALLETLPSKSRRSVIGAIASTWAGQDLDAAWRWAQSLTGQSQSSAISSLSRSARDAGSAKILSMADQITNQKSKMEFIGQCFSSSDSDPKIASEVLGKLPPEDVQTLLKRNSSILSYVMRNDPAAATQILHNANLPPDNSAWSNAASYYSQQDPAAAYQWASGLPEAYQQQTLPTILSQLANTDAPGALQKAQLLTNDDARRNALNNILSQWASSDPTAFEQALPQMTGEMRAPAIRQAISTKIRQDPPSAGTYLLNLTRSGNPDDAKTAAGSISNLASQWGSSDPKAAAAWLTQVPAGDMQDQFIQSLSSQWTSDDPMSSSIWIKDLPAGKSRDNAVTHLINNIATSDPESAVIWAGQIQNESYRVSSYQQSLRALLKKDPAAGQQAVQAAPISESLKASLLRTQ